VRKTAKPCVLYSILEEKSIVKGERISHELTRIGGKKGFGHGEHRGLSAGLVFCLRRTFGIDSAGGGQVLWVKGGFVGELADAEQHGLIRSMSGMGQGCIQARP
jgi:hypothetical protein